MKRGRLTFYVETGHIGTLDRSPAAIYDPTIDLGGNELFTSELFIVANLPHDEII